MVNYKLGDISFTLPTSYGELTFNQFLKLKALPDPENFISVLSVLSCVDKTTWEQCDNLDLDQHIYEFISFLNEPMIGTFILPDRIQIGDKWHDRPEGIALNTFGQKIALQNAIAKCEKEGKEEYEVYPYVVALFMQPVVTKKKYDSDEVDKLVPLTMDCKLNEIFPIATFFLTNYLQYFLKKKNGSHTPLLQKKSEPVSTSLKSSENYQRFGRWRRPLIKLLMKFSWKGIRLFT